MPELLRHHVDLLVDGEGLSFRRFSVAAQNRLRNYPWPGNVRELRNLVKRLLILGGAEEISLAEVEAQIATAVTEGEPLDPGTNVRVIRCEGNRLVVEKVENA